jgi:hypothetical protein
VTKTQSSRWQGLAALDADTFESRLKRASADAYDRMTGRVLTGINMSPYAERGVDCYETPPAAVRALLDVEQITGPIWEPACGPGAIVRVLREAGHSVVATDLLDYGCPDSTGGVDFLLQEHAPKGVRTILTNPPFMHADEFVRHALTLVPRVVMLLRLAFLEGQNRSDIIDGGQFVRFYVFRNRLEPMHRHGWDGPKIESNAIAFAWYVWDRHHSGPIETRRISWKAENESGDKLSANLHARATEVQAPQPRAHGDSCHCGKPGEYGYRDADGLMRWYCADHRLRQHSADARRDGGAA